VATDKSIDMFPKNEKKKHYIIRKDPNKLVKSKSNRPMTSLNLHTVVRAMETWSKDNKLDELTLPDRISNYEHNTSYGAPFEKRVNVKQSSPVLIGRLIVQISSSQTTQCKSNKLSPHPINPVDVYIIKRSPRTRDI
jgi:hypothetical protein